MKTLYIECGSPWENGYCTESFYGEFRNELLCGEIFYALMEVKELTAQYRLTYNGIRPPNYVGYDLWPQRPPCLKGPSQRWLDQRSM